MASLFAASAVGSATTMSGVTAASATLATTTAIESALITGGIVAGGLGLAAYAQNQAGQAGAEAAKMEAMAQAEQAQSQQKLSDYNAQIQKREAEQIEYQTAARQKQQRASATRDESSLQAGLSASGVVSTAGTPLMIQARQAAENELDNLMIGYEGNIASQRSREQAKLDTYQGRYYGAQSGNALLAGRMNADTARRTSRLQAGTTLLTGFGNYAVNRWGS